VHRAFEETCEAGPGSKVQPDPIYSVSAYMGVPGGIVSFSALRPAPGSTLRTEAAYLGGFFKRRHGMATLKFATVSAAADTFTVGEPPELPTSASVAPPPPFHGTATFTKTAGFGLLWEGLLSVDLPGMDPLALAGPSFQAQLCLDRHCHNRPIPATARRWPAQGSGSQSQFFWDDRLSWSR
jgi:hypothetical protein